MLQHIKSILTGLGWSVEEDLFTDTTPYGEKTFVNIMARQNPSATRHLTLACHYDSKLMSGVNFIGATDSAVPCAILLDIAGLLTASLSRVHFRCYSAHHSKIIIVVQSVNQSSITVC
jgi:glutaminyl-peptide cyclotransferase